MVKVIHVNEEVECMAPIEKIIAIKMKSQGETLCRIYAKFLIDATPKEMEWNIKTTISKEEMDYILNQPTAKFSGSKIVNSSIWVYIDENGKVFQGSGCGASISSPIKSLSGF